MEWNDDMLSAYHDGELPADTLVALEALLVRDAALRDRLERLRHVDAQLKSALPLLELEADEPLAARIRRSRHRLTVRSPRMARPFSRRQASWFAVAASLFGVVMGHLLTRGMQTAAVDTWMTASGTLEQALEQQPSGGLSIGSGSAARVMLSFKAADGRYCRAFNWQASAKAAEGLACRESGVWHLVALEATTASAAFRPAAGGAAAIDAAMDVLGGSESLDAEAEKQLIARQWRGP